MPTTVGSGALHHLYSKSRNSWQLRPQFNQRKLSATNLQAIGPTGYKCQRCVCVGLFLWSLQMRLTHNAVGTTTEGRSAT
jgi:hypothetical protein